jgi:RNA polymerase sigma factor (sigma-70 family)
MKIDIIDLINKAKKGNNEAQVKLYKYYRKKIEFFLKKKYPENHELDDDTSEIMIKIFENLEKYNQEKSKFNTWVTNIAKNYMIDKNRKYSSLKNNGLTYVADYSENFVDRSLVDKAYIDESISSFSITNGTASLDTEMTTNTSSINEPVSYYCAPDFNLEMSSSITFATSNFSENDKVILNMKTSGYNYKEIGSEMRMSDTQVSNKIAYLKKKAKEKGGE